MQDSYGQWYNETIEVAATASKVAHRVEKGSWKSFDSDGNVEFSDAWEWEYAISDGSFLGGSETRNGETTIWNANWQQGAKSRNVDSISDALTSSDGIAYELFGTAKYVEESRMGWNGLEEIETTYYSSSGVELGRSFKNKYQWTDPQGNTVTAVNTHYEGPDGTWLGNEFNDGNNGGWFLEKTYAYSDISSTIPSHLDLSGQTTLKVQKGSDTFSYKDANGDTQTETVSHVHYFNVSNGDHLGGLETRGSENIPWDADWSQGTKVMTLSGNEKTLSAEAGGIAKEARA